MVPLLPTATNREPLQATDESELVVPDAAAVHVFPLSENRIVPFVPTTTNWEPFQNWERLHVAP
jgi:hypothetical protein